MLPSHEVQGREVPQIGIEVDLVSCKQLNLLVTGIHVNILMSQVYTSLVTMGTLTWSRALRTLCYLVSPTQPLGTCSLQKRQGGSECILGFAPFQKGNLDITRGMQMLSWPWLCNWSNVEISEFRIQWRNESREFAWLGFIILRTCQSTAEILPISAT